MILLCISLSAEAFSQHIPESYFISPGSNSNKFGIVKYSLGSHIAEGLVGGLIGTEGISLSFFDASGRNGKAGWEYSARFNKHINKVYFAKDPYDIVYYGPQGNIFVSNFNFQLKKIGKRSWGWGLIYEHSRMNINDEINGIHGIGGELSVGGYPDIRDGEAKWPVSFKLGAISYLPQESIEDQQLKMYADLALKRMKKQGAINFYFAIHLKAYYDELRFNYGSYYYRYEDVIDISPVLSAGFLW